MSFLRSSIENKTLMKEPFLRLLFFLSLKSLLSLFLIHQLGVGLAPDEAQYWTWSSQLDWGYYSKPPGIAWQIFLGTSLLGDTEIGIRLPSVLLSSLLSLAIYFLARQCHLEKKTAFWSGMIMAFCPIGILSSFAATSDGGFILFWTLSSSLFVRELEKKNRVSLKVGLLIALGSLFKWPIYALWGFIIPFSLYYKKTTIGNAIVNVGVSLLGLLPSLYWNISHKWSTFLHVYYTIFPNATQMHSQTLFHGNALEFFASQMGALSPIYYFLLLFALFALIKEKKKPSPSLFFCACVSIGVLFFCHTLSFFNKMQANWALYAYPTGIVVLSWFVNERSPSKRKYVILGTFLSLALSLFTLFIPSIQRNSVAKYFPISYRINPFRHNLGWEQLSKELEKVGYDPEKHFLFSDKYQMSSILSFYGRGQKRAYFLNLHGNRNNQFSFWPGMEKEQVKKDAYFVITENSPCFESNLPERIEHYREKLSPYFQEVLFLGSPPIFWTYGIPKKGALIYKCLKYNGQVPKETDLY